MWHRRPEHRGLSGRRAEEPSGSSSLFLHTHPRLLGLRRCERVGSGGRGERVGSGDDGGGSGYVGSCSGADDSDALLLHGDGGGSGGAGD